MALMVCRSWKKGLQDYILWLFLSTRDITAKMSFGKLQKLGFVRITGAMRTFITAAMMVILDPIHLVLVGAVKSAILRMS